MSMRRFKREVITNPRFYAWILFVFVLWQGITYLMVTYDKSIQLAVIVGMFAGEIVWAANEYWVHKHD